MVGKVRINLTLTRDVLESFKKLVPNVSAEVDNWMRIRLVELQGGEPDKEDPKTRLKRLSDEYDKLRFDVVKLEANVKASVYFREASNLLVQLGMKKDLSNASEVIPRFRVAWKGDMFFLHQIENLVKLTRDMYSAEHVLNVMYDDSVKLGIKEDEKMHNSKSITAIVPVKESLH